ncbi:MAG: YcbK family protein, partial [Methylobacter sp.]
VAKHSLHMQGRAIDIRIEGVTTKTIRNAALAMGRGGVGYYPHANFVHLDTGEVRTW